MNALGRVTGISLSFVASTAFVDEVNAQSWDLVCDFSDAANPNGVWSYNAGSSPIMVHQDDWDPTSCLSIAQPAWAEAGSGYGHIPAWMKIVTNDTKTCWPADVEIGDVIVHANSKGNGNDVDLANVTWTSPVDDMVDVRGALWLLRDIGRSVKWTASLNGSTFASGDLFSGDSLSRADPARFNLSVSLIVGDVIKVEFVRTSQCGDFVGVNLTIGDCSGASWTTYGQGWPGTLGEPAMTAGSDPWLGRPAIINLENSLGADTISVLFLGLNKIDVPSSFDAHLLVNPFTVIPLSLLAEGITLRATIPCDPALCGVSVFLQAWEADSGASKGVSATPGLELVLGMT